MRFEIKARFSGATLFTAEMDARFDSEPYSRQLGEAIKQALKARANLAGANLARANLADANLAGADLADANLADANLAGANLAGANLAGANLARANLADADLARADLAGANLARANLARADLAGANLADAKNLHNFQIPQEGELIVWKKLQNGLAKLRVPPEAKRTATPRGRKCRAEFVEVLWLEAGEEDGSSHDGGKTRYRIGETVKPDGYNDDIRVECTNGIHFFLTKEEAEAY